MRLYALTILATLGLIAVGCTKVDTGTGPVVANPPAAPDNTAVNKRDADMQATKTPIDQKENQADVKTTAEIRKRIVDTSDLSVNARNAKIITADGKVTLRGPVDSESERELLGKIAVAVAGDGHVDNQLEVAAKP
jgi:osmotically-inducible protein OsmY